MGSAVGGEEEEQLNGSSGTKDSNQANEINHAEEEAKADRGLGRSVCGGCDRPERICLCSALPADRPLDSRSRVVLFIHPKEVQRKLGTAPLLKLCLRNLIIYEAERFPEPEEDAALHQALCEGGRECVLVCPGPNAEELVAPQVSEEGVVTSDAELGPPKTLIFVDGRWPQAKAMVNRSTWLRESLRRVVLVPTEQSGYRFRKQPEQGCLSTLEAVAEALLALEGARGPALKTALVTPFERMVDLQCSFIPEAGDKNARLAAEPPGADGQGSRCRFDLATMRQRGILPPANEDWQRGPGPRPVAVHCICRWSELGGVAGREIVVVEIVKGPLNEAKRRAADLSRGRAHGRRCWVVRPEKVPEGSLCEASEALVLPPPSHGGSEPVAADAVAA